MLTNQINEDSSFGDLVFSPEGKYLYISYADEGHPYFVFYDTLKFINNDRRAQLTLISEYRVDYIDEFYDNGDIFYSKSDCSENDVKTAPNAYDTEMCLFHYNFLTKKSHSKATDKGK